MAKKAKKAKPVVMQKSTVASIVADAFAELQGLGEELREWYDNLPEQFQNNRSDIDEAAGTLEGLSEPNDAPDAVAEMEVEYLPLTGKRTGRAARGGQATYEMGLALEVAQGWVDEQKEALEKAGATADTDTADDIAAYKEEIEKINALPGFITKADLARRNELTLKVEAYEAKETDSQSLSPEERIADVEEWIEEVQSIIDEADGVSYPGMFG